MPTLLALCTVAGAAATVLYLAIDMAMDGTWWPLALIVAGVGVMLWGLAHTEPNASVSEEDHAGR